MENNFIERIKEETNELSIKCNKLENFIHSDNFKNLSNTHQNLLLIQLDAMNTYWRCLTARLVDLQDAK
jgi:hypothetical protein